MARPVRIEAIDIVAALQTLGVNPDRTVVEHGRVAWEYDDADRVQRLSADYVGGILAGPLAVYNNHLRALQSVIRMKGTLFSKVVR